MKLQTMEMVEIFGLRAEWLYELLVLKYIPELYHKRYDFYANDPFQDTVAHGRLIVELSLNY